MDIHYVMVTYITYIMLLVRTLCYGDVHYVTGDVHYVMVTYVHYVMVTYIMLW